MQSHAAAMVTYAHGTVIKYENKENSNHLK